MAHGKIRVNTLTYDTGSGDVDVAVSSIPSTNNTALTGTPTAPTAGTGTNTTQIATTAFVAAAVDPDTAKTDVAQTFTKAQRGDVIDVTGATPSLDLNLGNNWKFTTSANWTSFTVSNVVEGQTGSIFIVYGGTHTGGFASQFKFVGGVAGLGALSSASGKIDRIDYIVLDSSTITCTITKDYIA